ncbi:multidrug effflux MFS transporter [Segetibacter sp.]|jgi:DHA1 family bicyclomycin/chloramphenicol resistance-like MFS transporter|uniref:multidrug effflux MFS transporter n=1 Tax=Segetibacter sp. TaxID=2231182 RepID=UPI0026276492|nr:multidrug effflux MFS transporter [Segetibacter sp.]MCW3079056.1 drug resistance transporter, Bcr/CflA subfamily [Segetibacter sp.]
MKGTQKFKLIIILGLLSAIGPFSIDMYLPAFPSIAADLHTTVAKISLSLSSFFIGISFGQMLYGPLLDRYGRKKPLYIGLSVYLVASIGCALATSADQLIWLRLIQALGSCSGMVASRAMVRDLFPVSENAKVFSLLMLVIGVSPIIAPTLGGYLTSSFGWHYLFAVLAMMAGLVLLAVHLYLPESRKPDPNFSLKPKPIIKGFLSVAKEPQFYTYALAGSIASAGLYAYIAGSPSVFMEIYKVSEKQYGWIFALVAIGLITSSQLNTLMLRKYKSEQIVVVALLCQSIIGMLLLTGTISGFLGLYSTIILCFLFLSCQGFTFPNTSALSLAPFSKNAGSASALLGSVQMGIGAGTSALVSYLNNGTAMPMAGVMSGCALSAFVLLVVGGKIIRSKATSEKVQEGSAEMLVTS